MKKSIHMIVLGTILLGITMSAEWDGSFSSTAQQTVAAATAAQGPAITDGRYVTVKAKNAVSWSSFSWRQREAGTQLFQHTYLARVHYQHQNGSTYLSLYDAHGAWHGYINQRSVSVASGPQGAWLPASGYVTLDASSNLTSDYALSRPKTAGTTVAGNTYKVTGQYHLFNGQTLYSVYDSSNQWLGYIDSQTVTLTAKQTGNFISKTGYVTIKKKDQPIWRSFFGKSQSTSAHYLRTYQIKGQYHAYTGAQYYSLYTLNGGWVGYLNATNGGFAAGPQGAWTGINEKVTLNRKGYPIWKGFFTDQVSTTTLLHNKTYSATGEYHHFNGSIYYSLYDGTTWVGYVNAAATSPIRKSGWYPVSGSLKYYDESKDQYTKTFAPVYYSQLDHRWSGKRYGGMNFGKTGCGQASIAMIVSGFGTKISPSQAADYAHRYGTFDTPGEVGSAQSDLTKVASHYGVNWKVMNSQGQLADYLKQGYPATVCLNLPGGVRHIVVLTGNNNGTTTVHDPWSNLLFSGKHKLSQVWGMLSWKADNRNMGATAAVVYWGK